MTTSYFSRAQAVGREVFADRLPLILINGARLAAVLKAEMLEYDLEIGELLELLDATQESRLGMGDPDQVLT